MEVYALDRTFADEVTLHSLANQYGTPFMLYDRATLEARTREIYQAFSWCRHFRQYFPVTALDDPEVLKILAQAGCGLVCGNAAQLRAAAGAGAKDILFCACFPTEEDLDTALDLGATVILDSPEQLIRVDADRYGNRVLGLRLASGKPSDHNKFGMTQRSLLMTAEQARDAGFTRLGLHMQTAGSAHQPDYYTNEAQLLLNLSLEIEKRTGIRVSWCDLGGGLAWDHRGQYTADLEQQAQTVRFLAEKHPWEMEFHTELGRWLAAPAGILVSRVLGVKRQGSVLVGVDASIAELPRSALAGVRYHVSVAGASQMAGRSVCYLAGPIMDRIDSFSGRYILPPLKPGDLLIFHGVGAFSRAMASHYGSKPLCPEVLLDRDGPRLL